MSQMGQLLIDFAELIYPRDTCKQGKLMLDILHDMEDDFERLSDLTPETFREVYEKDGHVPLTPKDHIEDMLQIMQHDSYISRSIG